MVHYASTHGIVLTVVFFVLQCACPNTHIAGSAAMPFSFRYSGRNTEKVLCKIIGTAVFS